YYAQGNSGGGGGHRGDIGGGNEGSGQGGLQGHAGSSFVHSSLYDSDMMKEVNAGNGKVRITLLPPAI
ncbi:MAG: hypothetical protein LBD89_08560, partial [Tannerellaceae bacterium]|nr:hypothetical protein [Tannerellaceae bacterium]